MTTSEARRPAFAGRQLLLASAATAGLGVAGAAAFLHFYPRADEVGSTAAALGDAIAWILGACLGLLIGSCATALLVQAGSRLFAGIAAGIAGFWVGVVPYLLAGASSDVTMSDALGFAFFAFVPGIVFVTAGAAAGVALQRVLARRRA
jgi:hypothetical protein